MGRQRLWTVIALVLVGCALASLPRVFAAVDAHGFVIVKPDELKWQISNSDSAPDVALLYGDPQKEGFYVLRARFRPGVMSRPHTHPNDRHVTVISGTWWAGTGKTFDPSKTTPLPPGSYMMHPKGEAHFDGAKDVETIVEIKGFGPAPTVPVAP
jgi:quercetin dioxygenase-like cupin family protein